MIITILTLLFLALAISFLLFVAWLECSDTDTLLRKYYIKVMGR